MVYPGTHGIYIHGVCLDKWGIPWNTPKNVISSLLGKWWETIWGCWGILFSDKPIYKWNTRPATTFFSEGHRWYHMYHIMLGWVCIPWSSRDILWCIPLYQWCYPHSCEYSPCISHVQTHPNSHGCLKIPL